MSQIDVLDHFYGATRESFLERSMITLERFVQSESKDMTDLFYYWRDLRISRGRLPGQDDLSYEALHEMNMLQQINVIDVSFENPWNFRVVLHAADAFVHSGIDMADRAIGEFPCRLHSRGLQLDYVRVKKHKAPRYFHIKQITSGIYRHYARVILPLASDGKNVDGLLTGIRTVESTAKLRPPPPRENWH